MNVQRRYGEFLALVREIQNLDRVEDLLAWDQQTYMPPRGARARAEELATIAGLRHDLLAGAAMRGFLDRLDEAEGGGLSADGRVNVRETRRLHDRARKIPAPLVRELARLQVLAQGAWVEARERSAFSLFAPHLEKIIDVKLQVADAVGFDGSRYDALLDEFEPGATTASIEELFVELRRRLVPFAQKVLDRAGGASAVKLAGPFPRAAQEEFVRFLVEAVGFDMEAGRIDTSAHPFTSGTLGDVRLTTRYDEKDPRTAIFGTLHEAGHGLYEQGLDPAHEGTPRATAVSLGIHESQSRLWENMVGRSREFWEYAFPVFARLLPAARKIGPEEWHRAVNQVEATCIRVDADEVTYNLHILLRFDLEKAIAEKRIDVADLSAAWNEKMRDYLGIEPPDDARGVLQDIHWSAGLFGYFPTYALGNLYAGQLWRAAGEAIADRAGSIRRGDFRALLEWLRREIHRRGQSLPAADLIRCVTGGPPGPSAWMDYIEGKYSALYDL